MTNEQLAANYSNPALLSNVMLAAAITDEDIETYIKFSYPNGGTVWRDVLEEAARRLTHKLRCASGIAEVVRRDDVERRIWTHYEHAREKHPYFCDTLHWPDLGGDSDDVASGAYLNRLQNLLRNHKEFINASVARKECAWIELLDDEAYEVLEAVAKGNTAAAVEECYDSIAVLLRVIDVLEGRQKLGRPEEGAAK